MAQGLAIRFGKFISPSVICIIMVSCLTTAKIPLPKINSLFNIEGIYVSNSDDSEYPFLCIKINNNGSTQGNLNTIFESIEKIQTQFNRVLTSDIEKRTEIGSMVLEGDEISLFLLIPSGYSMGRSHWSRIEYYGKVLNDSTIQLEFRKFGKTKEEYNKVFKRIK